MTKWQMYVAAATLFLAATSVANAACPPLSVYRVAGVTLADGTLDQAAKLLLADTAWRLEASPDASKLHVSLHDVGGPLDKVFAATLHEAGGTSGYALSSTQDSEQCVLHVNVTALAQPPSAVPVANRAPVASPAHFEPAVTTAVRPMTSFAIHDTAAPPVDPSQTPYTIPAGVMLSRGLADYVKRFGWTLVWTITDDYRMNEPFPIPAGTLRDGMTYVFNAYQSQHGLLGSIPDFHSPNKTVVVEPVTAAQETR